MERRRDWVGEGQVVGEPLGLGPALRERVEAQNVTAEWCVEHVVIHQSSDVKCDRKTNAKCIRCVSNFNGRRCLLVGDL